MRDSKLKDRIARLNKFAKQIGFNILKTVDFDDGYGGVAIYILSFDKYKITHCAHYSKLLIEGPNYNHSYAKGTKDYALFTLEGELIKDLLEDNSPFNFQ